MGTDRTLAHSSTRAAAQRTLRGDAEDPALDPLNRLLAVQTLASLRVSMLPSSADRRADTQRVHAELLKLKLAPMAARWVRHELARLKRGE